MSSSPWFHWAVYANNTLYEVTGDYKQLVTSAIMTEAEFLNEFKTIWKIQIQDTSIIDDNQVKEVIKNWVLNNPFYSIFDANCQHFAQHFANRFFGVSLVTQINEYEAFGNYLFGTVLFRMIVVMVVIILVLILVSSGFVFYGRHLQSHAHHE